MFFLFSHSSKTLDCRHTAPLKLGTCIERRAKRKTNCVAAHMPFDASFNPQRGGAGFGHDRSSSDADDSLWLHHSVNHDAHGCFGARVSWQAETQQQQRTQNLGVLSKAPNTVPHTTSPRRRTRSRHLAASDTCLKFGAQRSSVRAFEIVIAKAWAPSASLPVPA